MRGAQRRVVILAFDGCQPLDVVGPYEAFAAAGGYRVQVAGLRRGWIRGESGLGLRAAVALDRLAAGGTPPVHTFLVAGGAGARHIAGDPRLSALVTRVARRARRVGSVCTGAFVLARAGLLDGRRIATHWAHCAELAALCPAVQVDPDPIYIRDGRLWTSAGVTAGIDLALAMIEEDRGREVATAVARELVVFVRRSGGQSQFSAQMALALAERQPIRELQSFLIDHPEAPLDVPAMARRAGMSLRNFSRVFRAQVGASPAQYVEQVRLETARRLLESTALPVERVAEAAGFGTPEALRRSMARRLGLSPRDYRARFGAPPAPQPQGAPS